MSTEIIKDEEGNVVGIMTCGSAFHYKGFTFEVHRYLGPCRLKKNGDPSERQGPRFWEAYEEWDQLSPEEKAKTAVE
jgi:hypothetical protein